MLSLYILPHLPLHTPPRRNIRAPISGFGADVHRDAGNVLQGLQGMFSSGPGSWTLPTPAEETSHLPHRCRPLDTAGSCWLTEGRAW